MKTKTKMLALLEIAIVLCSVFLVALPAIAAEQKASASTSSITVASEVYEPDPLGIYGNANEDDVIDMRDTTYIKLVIFGKKPKTGLADANYDGKVSMLDVGQTKLIILGKEKKLVLIDDIGAIVTVPMPVERIIAMWNEDAIRALGAQDRIVGIDSFIARSFAEYPEISKLPSIGSCREPDIEKIIELEPDAVIGGGPYMRPEMMDDHLKGTDIVVIRIYPRNEEELLVFKGEEVMWPDVRMDMLKLGYVLGEVEKAREYVEWYDSIVNTIKERVSEISEDEKPKVFLEDDSRGGMVERESSGHIMGWEAAGANRIGHGMHAVDRMVSVEWIIDQNPDVYVAAIFTGGYKTDDESEFKAYYDEIMGLSGFGYTNAVKNDRVHIISTGAIELTMKLGIPIGIAYQAKWYHPELFEDLDPQAIHQEFIDRFCPGLDFDVSEHGVFVYPKPAW